MRGRITYVVALAAAVALLVPTSAAGSASMDASTRNHASDKRSHPLGDKQATLRKKAVEAALNGKAAGAVYEVAPGEFVELSLEGTDQVWTVLGEFSDYPHNSIPEPDRTVDNSTIWVSDFSRSYFEGILFAEGASANSMREYFLEQSSGRYTVTGDVTEWVTVPGVAASYDDGDPGRGSAANVWQFLEDSVDGWYVTQVSAGMTDAEINAYLATFDVWDRYDYDGDSNFNEPDGYIDHFQSLHSGEGNEAGGGELGDAAIWSHSWYARYMDIGSTGPAANPAGGIQIGSSGYWIGDYTIQPENGGVGVFAHEFTHDLGIPDLYDTNAGENSCAFWTLMDSGSWLSDNAYDLGSAPDHLGAWEKLQRGWLNYEMAAAGATDTYTLGPAEYNSTAAQALLVQLPLKPVSTTIGTPYAGTYFYYSGAGNNVDNWMYKSVTIPASRPALSARVYYAIETDYDYAFLMVSTDAGATWTPLKTNLSEGADVNYGITGFTRRWTALKADLSAYAGQTVLIGFRYLTDGGVSENGFMVDAIAITGQATDGAETDTGWTFDDFKRSTGVESALYENYYLAEYRQYWGYDEVLWTSPYYFGYLKGKDSAVNLVDHFPYQDGLLVWYCDDSQLDNNTSVHPGSGFALPVDAHPTPLVRADKRLWRNRIQTYDATFGLEATDAFTLHVNGKASYLSSLPAMAIFSDANSYWSASNPTGSVKVPDTGTVITVLDTATATDGGSYMEVSVTAP